MPKGYYNFNFINVKLNNYHFVLKLYANSEYIL